jgi:hypothetical protein
MAPRNYLAPALPVRSRGAIARRHRWVGVSICRDVCLVLCKDNRALLAENERLDDLVELAMDANDRSYGVVRQYQRTLMHHSELGQ